MAQTTDAQNLWYATTFVKQILWISWTDQDTLLWIYIQSAVAKIYELTWVDLLALWDQEKKFDGAGQKILFLWKCVKELSSVQYNENPREAPNRIDFDEYSYLLKDDGQVVFKNSLPRWYSNIKIEFELIYSDFNNIPREYADLKTALALLVGNLVESQKTTWIKSESVSWTTITFDNSTMTSNVQALLNKYLIIAL